MLKHLYVTPNDEYQHNNDVCSDIHQVFCLLENMSTPKRKMSHRERNKKFIAELLTNKVSLQFAKIARYIQFDKFGVF